MRLRDPGAGHERAHRVPPERHDDGRVEDLELAPQVRGAGRDLVRLRVAVVGRPALDDVGDEHVLAPPADRGEELDQEVAGPADEWPALPVLVEARPLADEDDLGLGVALARDGLGPRLVETAVRAGADLGGDRLERHPALDVGHAVASMASWLSVAPALGTGGRRAPPPVGSSRAHGGPRRSRRRSWPPPCAGCPRRPRRRCRGRPRWRCRAGPDRRRSRRDRRPRSPADSDARPGRPGR